MLKISIKYAVDHDGSVLHEVGNFQDELFKEIEMNGMGKVYDVDRIDGQLTIDISKKKDLGTINSIIKKKIQYYKLEEIVNVERPK